MDKFETFLLEKTIKFPTDEFDEYKNRIPVPEDFNIFIKSWLIKNSNRLKDEFIIQAIEDVAFSLNKKYSYIPGINFEVAGKKLSIYTKSGQFVFTCDQKITFKKIKKLIGI